MNIDTNYMQNLGISKHPQREEVFYDKTEPYPKDFGGVNTQTKDKNVNEDPLLNVNMPTQEKKALTKTLNEMDEKDKSITLMSVMAPSSINATRESEFLDFDEIMKRIDNILNPPLGGKPSAEQKEPLTLFKELFAKNFNEISEQNDQNRSLKSRDAQLSKAMIFDA